MHPRTEAILNDLGDEAQKAFETGGTWKWEPDTIEFCDGIPRKTGADTWCLDYHPSGFEVRDGKLFHVMWDAEQDGDWEVHSEMDTADPRYQEWYRQFEYENIQEAWLKYFVFVVQTGDDPLNEFCNLPWDKTKCREWQAEFCETPISKVVGLTFFGARRRGRGPWHYVGDLPQEVLNYLALKAPDGIHYVQPDWKTVDEMEADLKKTEKKVFRRNKETLSITFEVDEQVPPWREDRIQAYYRQRARKAIRDLKKRMEELPEQVEKTQKKVKAMLEEGN